LNVERGERKLSGNQILPSINLILMFIDLNLIEELNKNSFDIGKN
jgi:hypothetical protein